MHSHSKILLNLNQLCEDEDVARRRRRVAGLVIRCVLESEAPPEHLQGVEDRRQRVLFVVLLTVVIHFHRVVVQGVLGELERVGRRAVADRRQMTVDSVNHGLANSLAVERQRLCFHTHALRLEGLLEDNTARSRRTTNRVRSRAPSSTIFLSTRLMGCDNIPVSRTFRGRERLEGGSRRRRTGKGPRCRRVRFRHDSHIASGGLEDIQNLVELHGGAVRIGSLDADDLHALLETGLSERSVTGHASNQRCPADRGTADADPEL